MIKDPRKGEHRQWPWTASPIGAGMAYGGLASRSGNGLEQPCLFARRWPWTASPIGVEMAKGGLASRRGNDLERPCLFTWRWPWTALPIGSAKA